MTVRRSPYRGVKLYEVAPVVAPRRHPRLPVARRHARRHSAARSWNVGPRLQPSAALTETPAVAGGDPPAPGTPGATGCLVGGRSRTGGRSTCETGTVIVLGWRQIHSPA